MTRLEYATPRMPGARRRAGCWLLLVLTCITLLVEAIVAIMLYSATIDREGFGQVAAFMVAGPSALFEIPIAVVSCRTARRWRDPLAIVAAISFLVNAGAGSALAILPLGK